MSKKIFLTASAQAFAAGAAELQSELDLTLDAAGIPVEWTDADGLRLTFDGEKAVIACREKIHFFRLFAMLADRLEDGPFEVTETACFEKSGAMFDCSRNAVLTVDAFKDFLRKMGMMGLNLAMLYTEDTYEVPGHPYFGYMRGRYSFEELKELDDYADAFGIELIPCIQTLAHMAQYLRWPAAKHLADTDFVLLCGDPEVLEFIETCITAASAPFRSKRIHLGMDEAAGIGSGQYLLKNGYRPTREILREHMTAVTAICEKHGLEPMIWSDMCLRPLSPRDEYYDFADDVRPITQELTDMVPEGLSLIYWDYYHHNIEEYRTMIRRHQQFGNPLLFAGGSWNWSGPVPNYGKTFETTALALAACREYGIKEVFCTIWGDDGSDCSLVNALLGLQCYAENTYGGTPSNETVFEAFRRCCGCDGRDCFDIRLMDEIPGVPEGNAMIATPAKLALYQDVLIGLFDRHFEVQCERFGSMGAWYADRRDACTAAAARNPGYARHFRLFASMADILADKAEIGIKLRAAYLAGDKAAMKKLAAVLESLVPKYDALVQLWEDVWMSTNKPFGFEVISLRLGGARTRIACAARRVTDWAEGRLAEIPELAAERLFYDGRTEVAPGTSPLFCLNNWRLTVSGCLF